MKVIVISAHPDDMEIGCSGTLRRLQEQGAEIISVVTIKPSAEVNADRSQHIVEHELAKSYELSGFELRVLDTDLHPNGRPNLVCNNITMTALAELLEPCDIAIIPNPEDSHQDHRTTYELAWPLVKHLARETWLMTAWPYCLTYKTNSANLFYDVSLTWPFKQSLLEAYTSYIDPPMIASILDANRYWGQRNGCGATESFTIVNKRV